MQLHTQFSDRATLTHYLIDQFPEAAAISPAISPIRGGRKAAEAQMQKIQPEHYAATRNMLNGMVTRLSPYLKQGIITLAEVRRYVQETEKSHKNTYKLLQELAWRDYYQKVYERLANDIWQDIEPYKTSIQHYEKDLPSDIEQGTTGMVCIDTFAYDLRKNGYLHNHARLWTAAYIVHHRRIRWQAGAYWFLQHLLDGDPASNNLSWQWVASTFAAKPYYFNQENLARYSENSYCKNCPLLHNGCPFEGSYNEIAEHIFPNGIAQEEQTSTRQQELLQRLKDGQNQRSHQPDSSQQVQMGNQLNSIQQDPMSAQFYPSQQVQMGKQSHLGHQVQMGDNLTQMAQTDDKRAIIWFNEENLNPYGPAMMAYSEGRPVFVFDEAAISKAKWSLKRIAFIYECLLEIPNIQIYQGDPIEILTTLAKEQTNTGGNGSVVASTYAIDPHLQQLIEKVGQVLPIRLYKIQPFVETGPIKDLRRFSRYWREIESEVVNH